MKCSACCRLVYFLTQIISNNLKINSYVERHVFNGRMRRIHYFLYGLAGGLIFSVAYLIVAFAFGAMFDSFAVSLVLLIPCYIAYMWFTLAIGVKRLHDIDKSGWYLLILLIPIVNFIWALYMLFADGTVGPNRFGADPKNRVGANA